MKISNIANSINRSYSHMQNHESVLKNENNTAKKSNNDTVSISQSAKNAFGKQNQKSSILESLMKQRENLLENKNNLLQKTMEDGTSIEAIQERLDNYDQQIKDVDKQISQAMMQDQNEAAQKNEDKKDGMDTSNTKDTNVMSGFIELSGTIEQMEQLHSMQSNIKNKIRIIKSEISLDAERGIYSTSKLENISDLKENINKIHASIGEALNDVNETMKDSNLSETIQTNESNTKNILQSKELENKIWSYVKNQQQEKKSNFEAVV